ncbi:MAG: bifunctional 5,10-methylenetetrahydrofolate dehydrogenase/5,10-methenyltetrahydrofolate cyclohydrolase [Candidatus Krumholzibacteria bacterium]|nr:bifunctional 5,10-methylenetetrahydrofolate dehydrogenase/5,10-methenyltetrahydrofolate cyclohydrolase [Candidatus Krumholzibacteria bacterium]
MSSGPEKLIDGKAVAETIFSEVAAGVSDFSRSRRPPFLAVVIAGEDPASQAYVKSKVTAAARCGIGSTLIELPATVEAAYLRDRLDRLNADPGIDGILVQMPLPPHIDQQKIIESISPDKDVDGLHPYNLGRLASDKPRFIPCTPLGILELLARYGARTEGRRVVVVGRSILVGKPVALLLSRKHGSGNATVTICHSSTRDLGLVTREADILIVAIGKAHAIGGDMIGGGAVVIDVGMNRVPDASAKKGYRLTGDVDFESAYPMVSLITPVPGGVGPMTVAMLMRNTLQAARWAHGVRDDG